MKYCPSHKQLLAYVNAEASENEIMQIERHLQKCELCAEALPIYKTKVLVNENLTPAEKFSYKKKIFNMRQTLSIAASIIILLGLFVIVNRNLQAKKFAETPYTIKKTLMHKTSTSYWYIGNNKQIALNDNIISSNEFVKAINYENKNKQILIQVEYANTKEVEQIISKIKTYKDIPVYTFSKSRSIKNF